MYGTLRVDELVMPITDVQLIDGDIKLFAFVHGPCGSHEGPVRIFGQDGLPITENARGEATLVTVPEVRQGYTATVTYTLHVERIGPKKIGWW